jgi:hypothetical protein
MILRKTSNLVFDAAIGTRRKEEGVSRIDSRMR